MIWQVSTPARHIRHRRAFVPEQCARIFPSVWRRGEETAGRVSRAEAQENRMRVKLDAQQAERIAVCRYSSRRAVPIVMPSQNTDHQ